MEYGSAATLEELAKRSRLARFGNAVLGVLAQAGQALAPIASLEQIDPDLAEVADVISEAERYTMADANQS
jgi:hypothetical protein